jgi:hypothetical protein
VRPWSHSFASMMWFKKRQVRAEFLRTRAPSNAVVRLAKVFGAGEVAISRLPSGITPDRAESSCPRGASAPPDGRSKEKPQCSACLQSSEAASPRVLAVYLIESDR